jgi:hypothetical protein
MKSIIYIYLLGVFTWIILPACNTTELKDLNTNPDRIETANADYIFSGIVLDMINTNEELNQAMQYTSMYGTVGDVGGKQFTFPVGSFAIYTTQLNRIQQCMEALKNTGEINKLAICRILRADTYHRLTDAYGDVPYTDASKALEGNYKPKYDTQQSIYNDLFKELDEAALSFDPAKPSFGASDVLYNGSVVKWKKYAYTLMLRLGMRLTKVDPATAQQWVKKAIAGGVMTEPSDMAYLKYSAAYPNPRAPWAEYAVTQDGDNANGYKWSSTFINQLKSTKDPRLGVLSVVWTKTGTVYVPDTTLAVQRGMIPGSVFGKPADFSTYSEPSPIWWNHDTSPLLILGPAEAYLLLAEAALRGWYTGLTEKQAYDLGVTRAMQQWTLWPNVTTLAPNNNTITQAQISSYLSGGYAYKTVGSFDQKLEQISIQKWVSLMGDSYEVWSNWRRTGYPVMTWKNWLVNGVPGPYPGSVTGGEMFRRLPYPDETLTNNENQQEALKRQGFSTDVKVAPTDLLLTRVWWDKR